MQKFCRCVIPSSRLCLPNVPTYPSGQIGFTLCSTNPDTNFREPLKKLSREQIKKMGLRYYNSDVHKAAFVLPQFAREALRESSENGAVENDA
nr:spermidine synthase-like [Lytechinus pictus]